MRKIALKITTILNDSETNIQAFHFFLFQAFGNVFSQKIHFTKELKMRREKILQPRLSDFLLGTTKIIHKRHTFIYI